VVNHSLHFVDPLIVCGQYADSGELLEQGEKEVQANDGCHTARLALHLDQFMWRGSYGKTAGLAFTNICADISTQYPL
jgi:hypothetical protein